MPAPSADEQRADAEQPREHREPLRRSRTRTAGSPRRAATARARRRPQVHEERRHERQQRARRGTRRGRTRPSAGGRRSTASGTAKSAITAIAPLRPKSSRREAVAPVRRARRAGPCSAQARAGARPWTGRPRRSAVAIGRSQRATAAAGAATAASAATPSSDLGPGEQRPRGDVPGERDEHEERVGRVDERERRASRRASVAIPAARPLGDVGEEERDHRRDEQLPAERRRERERGVRAAAARRRARRSTPGRGAPRARPTPTGRRAFPDSHATRNAAGTSTRRLVQHDLRRVDPAELGDEREERVPERERVPGVEPAVPELVDRAQREPAEVEQLPHAREVEVVVAAGQVRASATRARSRRPTPARARPATGCDADSLGSDPFGV